MLALQLPDLNRPLSFEVICDACGVGIGVVLLQGGRPIVCDGKRLSPAEHNYAIGEKELHALSYGGVTLTALSYSID